MPRSWNGRSAGGSRSANWASTEAMVVCWSSACSIKATPKMANLRAGELPAGRIPTCKCQERPTLPPCSTGLRPVKRLGGLEGVFHGRVHHPVNLDGRRVEIGQSFVVAAELVDGCHVRLIPIRCRSPRTVPPMENPAHGSEPGTGPSFPANPPRPAVLGPNRHRPGYRAQGAPRTACAS